MAELVEQRILYSGWGRYSLVRIRLADGRILSREIEHHGDAVAVLPYCPERRVATLVVQMRASILVATGGTELLEAPAGGIGRETAESAARREVEEEAGLRIGALEFVTNVWSMPGISTERIALFLAAYGSADRVSAGGGLAHEGEEIRVVEHDLDELWAMVADGALVDMKTVLLLQALRLRKPELFDRPAGPGGAVPAEAGE